MKKIYYLLQLIVAFLIVTETAAISQTNDAKNKAKGNIKPSVSKSLFGENAGQKIYQFTLKNSTGLIVKVINYGATVIDIETPDRKGMMESIVLGFDSLRPYTGPENSLFGSAVGRVANRITNKKFTLDGIEYTLSSYIHGGKNGFDKRFWNIEAIPGKEASVKATYLSKDGEEGYPGNLNIAIVYTLTNNNEFKIEYSATTDKATPVVFTNHSYFNLSGGIEPKVFNTVVNIYADQYLESGNENIPTGVILNVKDTPLDFTQPKTIGKDFADIKNGPGYDLTYVLRNQSGKLMSAAKAYEPISGREMEVLTTEPGLIFYTGNWLQDIIKGRGGKPFTKQGAFCMETQHYPDSPNKPNFPNTILRPGETFKSQTVYKFSVR